MIVECPFCYTRVMPLANGACPACQEDMRGAEQSEMTIMQVHTKDHFPDMCCTCAGPAEILSRVEKPHDEGGDLPAEVSNFFFPFLGMRSRSRTAGFRVEMPQCQSCYRQRPIQLKRINFEEASLSVVVHRRFKEHCRPHKHHG